MQFFESSESLISLMVVRIRLARYGRGHAPYYRIMVADSRRSRDGKYLEHVGAYDPLVKDGAKHLRLNTERIRHWLACGAQPSDTVARLLEKANLMPPRPRPNKLPSLPDDVTAKLQPQWLAKNALPLRADGEPSLPITHDKWWAMVRGKQIPGLSGAQEFQMASPVPMDMFTPIPVSLTKQGVAITPTAPMSPTPGPPSAPYEEEEPEGLYPDEEEQQAAGTSAGPGNQSAANFAASTCLCLCLFLLRWLFLIRWLNECLHVRRDPQW